MNAIYKIIVFTFLLNISTGMITNITGWEVGFQDQVKNYDEINQSISPLKTEPTENPDVSQGSTSIFEDIFGSVVFGWYTAIQDFLNAFLFGIIDIMLAIVDMDNQTSLVVSRFLKLVLSLIYGFGLILFITGRRIDR